MRRIRKVLIWIFSCTAVCAVGYGVYSAVRSPLFLVQVVEVADLPEQSPLDAQAITDLASVPVGQANLFELDLSAVEKRILVNPWIREVRLQKRFPQTLSISVIFREPRAIFQAEGGALSYVDSTGKVFGRVNLSLKSDLPILSGIARDSEPRIREALGLLSKWDSTPVAHKAQISSLTWENERGFRAFVSYPFKKKDGVGRTFVDLGQEIDTGIDAQLGRLARVFEYLGNNSILARQIWADAGKKIVVKTARGS